MIKFNEKFQKQLEQRINVLPFIVATRNWTENNQAGNMEYHVIVRQNSEYGIAIKHYRFIDDGYTCKVPGLESIEYNSFTAYNEELSLLGIKWGVA